MSNMKGERERLFSSFVCSPCVVWRQFIRHISMQFFAASPPPCHEIAALVRMNYPKLKSDGGAFAVWAGNIHSPMASIFNGEGDSLVIIVSVCGFRENRVVNPRPRT